VLLWSITKSATSVDQACWSSSATAAWPTLLFLAQDVDLAVLGEHVRGKASDCIEVREAHVDRPLDRPLTDKSVDDIEAPDDLNRLRAGLGELRCWAGGELAEFLDVGVRGCPPAPGSVGLAGSRVADTICGVGSRAPENDVASKNDLATLSQYFAAWNDGGVTAVRMYWADDFEWHDAPDFPDGAIYRGAAAVTDHFAELERTLGDMRVEVLELAPLRDEVLAVLRVHVDGSLSGLAIDGPIFERIRLRGGKLARIRLFLDRAAAVSAPVD
jgi:ketosteroid isomerase-like protein